MKSTTAIRKPTLAFSAFICCSAFLALASTTVIAEPKAPEASLQIQSLRLGRSSADLTKKFSGRYYMENSPGISLQFLLTLNQSTLLPIRRDDVNIETFMDDTHQNLQNPNNGSYGYNQPQLSDDGHLLLFGIGSSRFPADNAGQVLVKGSINARVTRGKTLTATSRMTMMVGQEATIADFHTVVRSVSDQGGGVTPVTAVQVLFSVEGDASRIQKIKITDASGKVLNDVQWVHINPESQSSGRPVQIYVSLRSMPTEPVTIEYTYPETVEEVVIPFEAQIDLVATKIGPFKPSDGGSRSPHKQNPDGLIPRPDPQL